jgi:hypothetical protein
MEPSISDQDDIGHDEPSVHNWRVSQLKRLGVPATSAGSWSGGPACALVTRFTEGYAASVEPLSRALRAFGEPDGGGEDRRWLWLACRLAQDLWDDELWHMLATCGVRVARETGALNLLPNALNYLAVLNVHSGEFGTAAALSAEVDSITQATGIPPLKYAAVMLAVARGDQAPAQALLEWGMRNVTERGEGSAVGAVFRLAASVRAGNSGGRSRARSTPLCPSSPSGAFSFLKRGELFREASHRVEVQERPPTHAGHARGGQLGERRHLRQACDVHRAADFRGEAAQRVRLP